MTTNIYTKIEIELSNEEREKLREAMKIVCDIHEILKKHNANQLWYSTYDGEEMMTKAQVHELYYSLDDLINVSEIM